MPYNMMLVLLDNLVVATELDTLTVLTMRVYFINKVPGLQSFLGSTCQLFAWTSGHSQEIDRATLTPLHFTVLI